MCPVVYHIHRNRIVYVYGYEKKAANLDYYACFRRSLANVRLYLFFRSFVCPFSLYLFECCERADFFYVSSLSLLVHQQHPRQPDITVSKGNISFANAVSSVDVSDRRIGCSSAFPLNFLRFTLLYGCVHVHLPLANVMTLFVADIVQSFEIVFDIVRFRFVFLVLICNTHYEWELQSGWLVGFDQNFKDYPLK